MNTIYEKRGGILSPKFRSSNKGTIRQQNKEYFSRVGAVYVINTELVRRGVLFGNKILGVEVSLLNSFDIDEPEDWKLISMIHRELNNE